MPIDEAIKRIKEETGLSEDDIKKQIKNKMSVLEGLVSEEGAAYIIASELGVKLFKNAVSSGPIKIKNVLIGMRNLETIGKIVRIFEPRTYTKDGKENQVGSVIIGDETGTIRVVIWDSSRIALFQNGDLKEGDVIRIRDAYTRESNLGGKEIHLNIRSQIVKEAVKIDVREQVGGDTAISKKISELIGGEVVRLLGTVVQIYNPYFYQVCSQCEKKIQETDDGLICAEHGNTASKSAMVLSFVLDDSTDNIRCVAFRNQAEKLAGTTAQSATELLEKSEIELTEKLDKHLLGKVIEIQGTVKENKDFERKEVLINRSVLKPNAAQIAKSMLK